MKKGKDGADVAFATTPTGNNEIWRRGETALAFGAGSRQIDGVDSTKALLETRPARLLNGWAVLWINMYGLLLGAPFIAAVAWVSFQPLSVMTFLIPLALLAWTAYCLPIGLGNPYVRRLVGRIDSEEPGGPRVADGHVVQIATRPRLRTGFMAVMEDADDVGRLKVANSHIYYEGDSIRLQVPLAEVRSVILRNVGFRGLFIYGARIVVSASLGGGREGFEIADRSSLLTPQSRRVMRRIYKELSSQVSAAGQGRAPDL